MLTVGQPPKWKYQGPEDSYTILFTEQDLDGLQLPHEDALVVEVEIDDTDVRRILIDQGSSADRVRLGRQSYAQIHHPCSKAPKRLQAGGFFGILAELATLTLMLSQLSAQQAPRSGVPGQLSSATSPPPALSQDKRMSCV
ncbi:hypothetical protein Vadar_033546 [Vaccinium darrowii]|uniref:Uncharacterized protein n=1 Tax=Vaccinium darrowii TaxID=229202 RepID=A0ACB7Z0S3_9ERIC|nr:hypothetical protein Vadar_033546 [Vaccinium darrowii]